jgi:hypothetical protein
MDCKADNILTSKKMGLYLPCKKKLKANDENYNKKIERRRKMYFNQETDTDSFSDDFLKMNRSLCFS